MLDDSVDEKYYLTNNMLNYFMGVGQKPSKFPRKERFLSNIGRKDQDRANSVTTNAGNRPTDNFVITDCEPECIGGLGDKKSNGGRQWFLQDRVYDNKIATTVTGAFRPYYKTEEPRIVASRGRGQDNQQQLEPRKDNLTNTITSVQKDNLVAIRTANKQGYDFAADGDGVDLAYPESNTRRGRVGHGVAKTIPTGDSQGVLDGMRIRKLTPKECWRLMGFDDDDFAKAEKVCSNTQLYKQAGNSIVVNVLEAILGELFKEEEWLQKTILTD